MIRDQLEEIDPRLLEFVEPLLTIIKGSESPSVQRMVIELAILIGASTTPGYSQMRWPPRLDIPFP